MPQPALESSLAQPGLPESLPVLRLRLTLRLQADARLPAYKGALLRGSFGYAFQRAACPRSCWGRSDQCGAAALCAFRWVFATPHPPGVAHLHDLHDPPRPFVIDLPDDGRTSYAAGEALEFGLALFGRGIEYLPFFLHGFEEAGRAGLGRDRAGARLERVVALAPWQPDGAPIYQDGRLSGLALPLHDTAAVRARAGQLPADLRLTLRTPLRLKTGGNYQDQLDLPALVRAACWRLNALATFHGAGPWPIDHRSLVEQAATVSVEQTRIAWRDWERTSTRGPEPRRMALGGIVGSALLHGVSPDLRAILLAASLVHVGKACVFGHGALRLDPALG
ncbi:MAG: CRISPR system precrRNA processing endoribonuclease RAMP protein Cas6 [Roseiflexaceae bacterium]